jgi:hypothetical protein
MESITYSSEENDGRHMNNARVRRILNSVAGMGASSPQSTVQPYLPSTTAIALTMLRATDVQYSELCPSSDCRPRCSLALTREPLAGSREGAVNRDHCQVAGSFVPQ